MPWRSDIPHKQQARGGYPGLQEMMAFSLKDKDYSPASTNLFTIHIVTPALLKNWNAALGHNSSIGYNDATFMPDASDKLGKCLNFYCQTISIPSKQVTTGSLVNIGTATKYATGSAFSQISATFIAPKSQHSRNFFERWIQMMAPDSNQYSDYYDDHSDALRMQKNIRQTRELKVARLTPWYQQTTEFTCGPAALLMAMGALEPTTKLSQTHELALWREGTTIFMTSGYGGCHPFGLALAANKRGFKSEVMVNTTEPLFLDGVRSENKKVVLSTVHQQLLRYEYSYHEE